MPRIIRLENVQQFTAINVLSDPGHIAGPVVAPQCMEVRLFWANDAGKGVYNVLHARYPGAFPGSIAMANAIMTAVTNSLTTRSLLPQMAPTSALQQVQLRDINSVGNPYIASTNTSVVGTGTGAVLPAETAVVLTLRTAKTGPDRRGRCYIPNWMASAMAAGNTINSTVVANLGLFGTDLRAGINAQGITMCLALPHRQQYTGSTGRVHPERLATTEDVTSVIVRDNHWDTQRRRGLK